MYILTRRVAVIVRKLVVVWCEQASNSNNAH